MKKLYALIIITTLSYQVQAQDLDAFLEGSIENANTLLEGYISPAFTGLGYSMTAGWYNTARPHKLLGFDLTFGASYAVIPTSGQAFRLRTSENMTLENPLNENSPFYIANGTPDKLPTAIGKNLNADDIPFIVFNPGTAEEIKFTAPSGLGFDELVPFDLGIPGAYAQIGVGLPKNTELKLRLLPVSVDDGSVNLFGIGILHDIKQWIPGIKNLPFDLSGFVGYNRVSSEFEFDKDLGRGIEFQTGGTTVQGIISYKLAVLTGYAGLGFTSTSTDLDMVGDYSSELGDDVANPSISTSSNSFRGNIGLRLKLAIFTLHAEYALQEYNTLTAGIGLSVR